MKPNIRQSKTKFAKRNRETIFPTRVASFINDSIAILLFAVAIMIALALASHSLNDSCWSKSIDSPVVYNMLGVIGAYLSDVLLYIFGYSAWWLVIGIFYIGFYKINRHKIPTGNWSHINRIISYILLIATSASFEYIIFFQNPSKLPDGFGGSFGSFVFNLCYHFIGEIGVTIISLVLAIICLSFSFKISWLLIAEKIGAGIELIYIGITTLVSRKDDDELESKKALAHSLNNSIIKREAELDALDEEDEIIDKPLQEKYKIIELDALDELDTDDNLELAIEKKDKPEHSAFSFTKKLFGQKKPSDEPIKATGAPDFDLDVPVFTNDEIEIEDNVVVQEEVKPSQPKQSTPSFYDLPVANSKLEIPNVVEVKETKVVEPEPIKDTEAMVAIIAKGAAARLSSMLHPDKVRTVVSDGVFHLPSTALLNLPKAQVAGVTPDVIEYVSNQIQNTLAEFGIDVAISNVESGPVITRYELVPPKGVRGDKIASYSKEIARSLALNNIRILENIPGKNSMGIEVPNVKRQVIYLKEIFDSVVYHNNNSLLTLALGKDIAGEVIVTDLAKMPHLLVAGTTGSGKSVAVNAMILSILFNARPDQVKFIMIDPKMVELSFYEGIPHLLAPVVTDMSQAANALKWAVGEMENRYKIMAKMGTKNIIGFNQKIEAAIDDGKPLLNPYSVDPKDPEQLDKWPYIVIIIDELADLMMVAGKKIEQYIARIAQKARAVGIHLIVATQRPSVDVITGLIKANIPARISFQVSSKIDSRTILDQMGAETLLGQGDMLSLNPGSGFPRRIHGAFVNDDELNKVVDYLKSQGEPDYNEEILTGASDIVIPGFEDDSNTDNNSIEKDTVFDQAVKFIIESKRCSISSLQTQFGIGYNKAARIMNHLEKIGMVRRTDRGGFELLNQNIL